VIVPDLGNPYFHAILQGAQARARRADYAVFVADGQESVTEEEALIKAMRKQVDGIVLCSSRLPTSKLASPDNPPGAGVDMYIVQRITEHRCRTIADPMVDRRARASCPSDRLLNVGGVSGLPAAAPLRAAQRPRRRHCRPPR
jgi:Periplasmic binding proteins and sugar binding domain of LacI family